jgi:two-component system cell cycle response regulator DivK
MARDQILIVDDHPVNMKLTHFVLDLEGYEVMTAESATQALEILASFPAQLILMDLQMPGMNGYELTKQLRSDPRTKDILILAVTAYAMKGDEERALAVGCDGYVTKPIDPDELPGIVGRLLETCDRGTKSVHDLGRRG